MDYCEYIYFIVIHTMIFVIKNTFVTAQFSHLYSSTKTRSYIYYSIAQPNALSIRYPGGGGGLIKKKTFQLIFIKSIS